MSVGFECVQGQSYDNTSNMSGKFKDVMARVLKESPQAYFTLFSAHTLNLCKTYTMETCTEIQSYFRNAQKLYNALAASLQDGKLVYLSILLPKLDGVQE